MVVRAAPPSTLSVISEGELAATMPLTLVPSRITTVACGRSATAGADSCFAQDARNITDRRAGTMIKNLRIGGGHSSN
jgi:hypothetical protein